MTTAVPQVLLTPVKSINASPMASRRQRLSVHKYDRMACLARAWRCSADEAGSSETRFTVELAVVVAVLAVLTKRKQETMIEAGI